MFSQLKSQIQNPYIEQKNTIIVNGPSAPLQGIIHSLPGSKNSAMPILVLASLASLTTKSQVVINNLPQIDDIFVLNEILQNTAVTISSIGHRSVKISSDQSLKSFQIHSDLSSRLRGSIYSLAIPAVLLAKGFIGPIGGDVINGRSFAPHTRVLQGFGLNLIEQYNGYYLDGTIAKANEFFVDDTGVTATSLGIIIAAATEGTTIMHNASCELENDDVIEIVNLFGAKAYRENRTIVVTGPMKFGNFEISLPPDHIVFATYAIASLLTHGKIMSDQASAMIKRTPAFLEIIQQMGAVVSVDDKILTITSNELQPINCATGMYPKFPCDLLPQLMVLMTQINGVSHVQEMLYENRFAHVQALNNMGADILIHKNHARINGRQELLVGRTVNGSGIRETCALALAGFIAKGQTSIKSAFAINRGYENFVTDLQRLGANIEWGSIE